VIAVASVFVATHITDLGAAIVRAVGTAPVASPNAAVPAIATPAPATSHSAAAAAQPAAPAGGTCIGFPAGGSPSGRTVFVDAGHGGPDPGATGEAGGARVVEKAVTLAVAKLLTPLLQNDGYKVVMSRTGDSFVAANPPSNGVLSADDIRRDLLARIACANRSGANLLISIHFNALNDASVAGSETFYDAVRPFAAGNRRLAIDLERSMTATLGSANLGVWPDDQNVGPALSPAGAVYGHFIELGPPSPGYVDSPSQMTGALVEPLFLSNRSDAQEASNPGEQQLIALAIARGIRSYFNGD
jgi:N-acetylmuramoyl-L-alanine amidase